MNEKAAFSADFRQHGYTRHRGKTIGFRKGVGNSLFGFVDTKSCTLVIRTLDLSSEKKLFRLAKMDKQML